MAVDTIVNHVLAHASTYTLIAIIALTATLLLRLTVWNRKSRSSNELFR